MLGRSLYDRHWSTLEAGTVSPVRGHLAPHRPTAAAASPVQRLPYDCEKPCAATEQGRIPRGAGCQWQ